MKGTLHTWYEASDTFKSPSLSLDSVEALAHVPSWQRGQRLGRVSVQAIPSLLVPWKLIRNIFNLGSYFSETCQKMEAARWYFPNILCQSVACSPTACFPSSSKNNVCIGGKIMRVLRRFKLQFKFLLQEVGFL